MLGVKPISLPYVDGDQSDKGKDNHGNKASQLAQDDGKVRKRPLIPMNSNGFCMPLYIGKKSSIKL